jgi:hypothetical protein
MLSTLVVFWSRQILQFRILASAVAVLAVLLSSPVISLAAEVFGKSSLKVKEFVVTGTKVPKHIRDDYQNEHESLSKSN